MRSVKKPLIKSGFTIIELLVVVSVIAILSGVVLRVVNVGQQEAVAKDAVKKANLEKIAIGIQTFVEVEGMVPPDTNSDGNPLNDTILSPSGSTAPTLSTYLKVWPGETGEFIYNTSGDEYIVYTILESDLEKSYKYYSSWGEIRECSSISIQPYDACDAPKEEESGGTDLPTREIP